MESQAIFMLAAVWITVMFFQNAISEMENSLCFQVRQLKRKQL
jgi:hypothetical protein